MFLQNLRFSIACVCLKDKEGQGICIDYNGKHVFSYLWQLTLSFDAISLQNNSNY